MNEFHVPMSLMSVFLIGVTVLCAQPGPPRTDGTYTSISGTITQLNYGPELEVNGFVTNSNVIVTFPPHVGPVLGTHLAAGHTVKVDGYASTTVTGVQRLEMVSLTNSTTGKTFTLPQPGQASQYSGSGRVTQLNYNREGEVDGFLLDSGIFAKTPPRSDLTLRSQIQAGESVSIAGFARQTVSGQTVVDVQTLNGQPLAPGYPVPPAGPPR